jgi:serine/threonine protein kinase/Tol biopolymer transport system component
MGEVYRARDPRLGRDVAIKVLPSSFAADADRLRRFEQEARAAAALNHPNILTVHEIGTADGPYIVSELLEGQTLRATLDHGGLPVKKAIDYALQMARGLSAAHDHRIVHRDLKPENVFVTSDGRVKILDFGLAKLSEPAIPGVEAEAPPTRAVETMPGVVMGTLGYMSPEQVRGLPVDQRSDIFSFGAILHEMVHGGRAFEGDTPADTISAILNLDPPEPARGQKGIPPALDRVVRHCLEKSPERRFQSSRDLAFALEGAVAEDVGPVAPSPPHVAPNGRRWSAILTGLAAWFIGRSASIGPGDPVVRGVVRMTHEPGFSEWPTWSGDGNLFAFSSNRGGNFEIYVRRVEGGQEVNITNHPSEDVQPAFSPNGTTVAFVSTRASQTGLIKIGTFIGFDTRTYGGDVWLAPTLGGEPRRLAENGNFPVWHPDGRRVLYLTGPENQRVIAEMPIDGGPAREVLTAASSEWEITRVAYSPDARWITFETVDRWLFAMPADGGQPRQLLRGSSHSWDPTGRRVYYAFQSGVGDTRIDAANIDESPAGLSVGRTITVGFNTGVLKQFALAADGRRLLVAAVEESMNLTRVALAAGGVGVSGPEEELSSGQVRDRYPMFSPDGQRIAVGSNRIGDAELWVVELGSTRRRRIELPDNASTWVMQACWARDGEHLAVLRFLHDGRANWWYVALDGSSAEELISARQTVSGMWPCEFSPDGQRLVYGQMEGQYNQLFLLDMKSRKEQQLTRSPSHKYDAAWSPNGRWIAFSANDPASTTGQQAWRIPSGGGQEEPLTTTPERIRHQSYSPDGGWLYVQPSHGNIYRVPADGGPMQQVTHFPESVFLEEPRLSPDGRHLVYNRGRGGSSLWMLTIAPDDAPQ